MDSTRTKKTATRLLSIGESLFEASCSTLWLRTFNPGPLSLALSLLSFVDPATAQNGVREALVERGMVRRGLQEERQQQHGAPRGPPASFEKLTMFSLEQPGLSRPYDRWLRRLLEHILEFSSNKDKSFSQFMVDLPEVPSDEISRLGEMCTNPDQSVRSPPSDDLN